MKEKKHYLAEIKEDHRSLAAPARAHIEQCKICQQELEMMHAIETSVKTLPVVTMPVDVRRRLIMLMQKPFIKIWHFLTAIAFLFVGPYLLGKMIRQFDSTSVMHDMYIYFFAFTGVLAVLMLIPISFRLWQKHQHGIHSIENTIERFFSRHF